MGSFGFSARSRNSLYATHDPQLQCLIPHRDSELRVMANRCSHKKSNTFIPNSVDVLVADMRQRAPQLCTSIFPGFDLREIFHPDMLQGCGCNFLRCAVTQIAMENLANVNQNLRRDCFRAQNTIHHLSEIIGQQQLKIRDQDAQLSAGRDGDKIHLKEEAWGYGHAETGGPSLVYDSSPIPPVVSTIKPYDHGTSNQRIIVAMPLEHERQGNIQGTRM